MCQWIRPVTPLTSIFRLCCKLNSPARRIQDTQTDGRIEGQTYSATVWQPVSRSASQPVGSCRRHLTRNFYSPLGLIWSRCAVDFPSSRRRSTLPEYLLCFIFCALLLFSLYIYLYDFHRLSPYGLKECDSRSYAWIPCTKEESWESLWKSAVWQS